MANLTLGGNAVFIQIDSKNGEPQGPRQTLSQKFRAQDENK